MTLPGFPIDLTNFVLEIVVDLWVKRDLEAPYVQIDYCRCFTMGQS